MTSLRLTCPVGCDLRRLCEGLASDAQNGSALSQVKWSAVMHKMELFPLAWTKAISIIVQTVQLLRTWWMRRREYTPFGGTSTVHLTAKNKIIFCTYRDFEMVGKATLDYYFPVFSRRKSYTRISLCIYIKPHHTRTFSIKHKQTPRDV